MAGNWVRNGQQFKVVEAEKSRIQSYSEPHRAPAVALAHPHDANTSHIAANIAKVMALSVWFMNGMDRSQVSIFIVCSIIVCFQEAQLLFASFFNANHQLCGQAIAATSLFFAEITTGPVQSFLRLPHE